MATVSSLEHHAEEVALDLLPDNRGRAASERGIDFVTIFTLVISILQTIVENCPQPPTQMKDSFRRPTMRQKAALLKITKEHCDCCHVAGGSRTTGAMYNAILVRGSKLSDADADALIQECLTPNNLLI